MPRWTVNGTGPASGYRWRSFCRAVHHNLRADTMVSTTLPATQNLFDDIEVDYVQLGIYLLYESQFGANCAQRLKSSRNTPMSSRSVEYPLGPSCCRDPLHEQRSLPRRGPQQQEPVVAEGQSTPQSNRPPGHRTTQICGIANRWLRGPGAKFSSLSENLLLTAVVARARFLKLIQRSPAPGSGAC